MNKHAYLIMAHGNWNILEKLILLLDDEKNDIYLHIDVRSKGKFKNKKIAVEYSKVEIIESIPVFWADFSQVDATLRLLRAAKEAGEYSYYHLLSGSDLPLKSNNEIYNFFEKSGREFIGIVPKQVYYSVRRVKFYHPFLHNRFYRNSTLLKGLDRVLEYIQKVCGVNRLRESKWKIIDGWTWFSVTDKFCDYVLSNEKIIRKMFNKTIASDELFMQTLVYNSSFVGELYDIHDLKNGSMRFIDWQRGKPYTWGKDEEDFEILMQSPYMFARKFDESNSEIVEQIYREIDRRNKNDK